MYGRYTYKLAWKQVVELYRITQPDKEPEGLIPTYNVAPTHIMPIIRPAGNGRELLRAGWGPGAVLAEARSARQQPFSTINARSDRVQTAPTYREPRKTRRCLAPASSRYEWQKVDTRTKCPYHFTPKAAPFAFGGVYDVWKGDGKAPITSFAIVTTAAAPSTAPYHDRMPLVLEESQFEDWMCGPPNQAAEMMKPYAGAIDVWEVSREVGNVRNNKPELMELVGLL